MYVCAFVYVYTHVQKCERMCVCLFVHLNRYVCMHMQICVRVYAYKKTKRKVERKAGTSRSGILYREQGSEYARVQYSKIQHTVQ